VTDPATLAAALINTKHLPPGLGCLRALSAEARAYDTLSPYPEYWFRDWKVEDRGPLPRCMPLAKSIVRRGARWLFGKPVRLYCPGNTQLEEFLRQAWEQNRLDSRLVASAQNGALDGGIVLKFAWDEGARRPLTIQTLSLVDQVRLYWHPHDRDQLLMARVQYPYFDPASGKTFWYREEWTAELEVHYHPVAAENLGRGGDPDTYDGWIIDSAATGANPFGLIPLQPVKNMETEDCWGAGDLWDLYRVFDRVNLTYHLMDRSNQFDSERNPIFIDADVDEDDIDRPLQPGQPMEIHSRDQESNRSAKVEWPITGNALRPAMMEYARDLRKQILDAVGSVFVNPEEITNKGNLTRAVLEQLYQPLIEMTAEKRKSYGADGLVPFFAKVAQGLQNVGVPLAVTEEDETHTVELRWPAYFEFSEDERGAFTGRIQEQVAAGFVTHDRAIERVAQVEGIEDVDALKDELKKQPAVIPMPQLGADPLNKGAADERTTTRRLGGPLSQ
jgi:hypothetical protein